MTENRPSELLLHPFWSDSDVLKDARTGCWIWQNAINRSGYGTGTFKEFGTQYAHRAFYMAANGLIDSTIHVHHRCRDRACVNPDHLEGTSQHLHLIAHKQFDSALSWADVNEIRRVHREGGTSIQELGERYGISKSEVFNIVANIKWPDPTYTPGRLAQCEECDEAFTATRSNQRFCCAVHRQRWNGRMGERRRNGTPLDAPRRAWARRAA